MTLSERFARATARLARAEREYRAALDEVRVLVELAQGRRNAAVPPAVTTVAEIVCHHFGVAVDVVYSKSRPQEAVDARSVAAYICHVLCGFSPAQLDRLFRHSSGSARSALQRITDRCETDRAFRDLVLSLQSECARSLAKHRLSAA